MQIIDCKQFLQKLWIRHYYPVSGTAVLETLTSNNAFSLLLYNKLLILCANLMFIRQNLVHVGEAMLAHSP